MYCSVERCQQCVVVWSGLVCSVECCSVEWCQQCGVEQCEQWGVSLVWWLHQPWERQLGAGFSQPLCKLNTMAEVRGLLDFSGLNWFTPDFIRYANGLI